MGLFQSASIDSGRKASESAVQPINSGVAIPDNSGGNFEFGGWAGDGAGGSATKSDGRIGSTLGKAGSVMGMAGIATGNADLAGAGRTIGQIGGVIGASTPEQAAARAGAAIAGRAGVPGAIVGPALSAFESYSRTGSAESAAKAAGTGLLNSLAYSTPIAPVLGAIDIMRGLSGQKGLISTMMTPVEDIQPTPVNLSIMDVEFGGWAAPDRSPSPDNSPAPDVEDDNSAMQAGDRGGDPNSGNDSRGKDGGTGSDYGPF